MKFLLNKNILYVVCIVAMIFLAPKTTFAIRCMGSTVYGSFQYDIVGGGTGNLRNGSYDFGTYGYGNTTYEVVMNFFGTNLALDNSCASPSTMVTHMAFAYSRIPNFLSSGLSSWQDPLAMSCGNTHTYTRDIVQVPVIPEIPENPTPVYAMCGRNSAAYSYGTTQYLGSENIDFCAIGTLRGSNPAFPTNAGAMWICEAAGTNRLYDRSCFASVAPEPLIPGECGTEPDQCRVGNLEYVPDSTTEFLWNCRGSNTYGREVPGNLDMCSMDKDDYDDGGFDPVCRVSPLVAKVNSPITWSVEGLGSSSANFGFSWFDMYGANDPFDVESQHGQTVQITSPNSVSFINLMVTILNPFVVPAPTIICPTAKFVDEIIVEMDPPIVDENETCTLTWSKAPSASQCSIYNEEGVSVKNISGLPAGSREVTPGNKYYIGCELMTQPTGFVESEHLACMKSGTLIEI